MFADEQDIARRTGILDANGLPFRFCEKPRTHRHARTPPGKPSSLTAKRILHIMAGVKWNFEIFSSFFH
ncbi:hypothetical protein [Agrobacterium sp. SORGH_AS_0440]|uniref:hypothetical protein n=1 Tax=Agrobacterium sp. SORGH_AS_0440 TaxID=3041757 RepID=UPI002859B427|nr:hypothetical protein [Agrobacterium sp. SORGH_AS_0440]MDR6082950.1 hypothetical protein [Agrobacterium sp. SORGH_AS_0440]